MPPKPKSDPEGLDELDWIIQSALGPPEGEITSADIDLYWNCMTVPASLTDKHLRSVLNAYVYREESVSIEVHPHPNGDQWYVTFSNLYDWLSVRRVERCFDVPSGTFMGMILEAVESEPEVEKCSVCLNGLFEDPWHKFQTGFMVRAMELSQRSQVQRDATSDVIRIIRLDPQEEVSLISEEVSVRTERASRTYEVRISDLQRVFEISHDFMNE